MRSIRLMRHPVGHAGELPGVEATPRTCQWSERPSAAALADVDEHLVVVEPAADGRVGDEAEHAARFLVRENVDVAERVDVATRQDEQARLRDRLMSWIATNRRRRARDRPRDEPAEQAALSGGDGSPPRRAPDSRAEELADLGVLDVVMGASRPRNRGRAGRRGRGRWVPTFDSQRLRESASDSARRRALRSRLTADGAQRCPRRRSPCRAAASTGMRGRV